MADNIFDLQATISLNSADFRSGVNQAQTAFAGLGSSVSAGAVAIGNILADMATKAVSALGDFARSAIDTGMNFDASMSNVKAISGATGEEFDELRAKAKEMGATTKFTATEAADAFSYMAMAGWKTGDMLDGIEGIMNLAAASGEDLARTSDIVTDALTAFGLTAADSGRFADVLAAASSNANTNVGMMGDTFKYVAPVAGALGYSIDDVAVAIGLMANSGVKGSQAGTALRAALSRLVKPTDDVAGALNALGLMQVAEDTGEFEYNLEGLAAEMAAVEKAQDELNKAVEKYGKGSDQAKKQSDKLAEAQSKLQSKMAQQREEALSYNAALVDANGNMIPFSETITRLREAFAGLSEAEQAEYAATIFGQEAMSGMLAIVNSSEEDYNKLAEAIAMASDAMDGQGTAASMAQTQIENLSGKLTIFQSAFDGLKVAIYDNFSQPLSEAVDFVTGALSELTLGLEEGGVGGAFERLGEYISTSVQQTLIPQFGLAKTSLEDFVGSANELISSFPGGDAILSVAESVTRFGETVVTVSSETIDLLTRAVKDFVSAFDKEEVSDVIDEYADSAADLFNAFADAHSDAIEDVGNALKIYLNNFDNEGAAEGITEVADASAGLFATMSSSVADRIEKINERFNGFASELAELAVEFPIDFGKMGEAIGGIIEVFTEMGDKFEQFTRPIRDFFGDILSRVMKGAVSAVVGGVGGIINALSDIVNFIKDNLLMWVRLIEGDFKGAWEAIQSTWGDVGQFFKDIWETIKGIFSGAKSAFDGIGRNMVNGLINGFKSMWQSFTSTVSSLADGAVDLVKGIFGIASPSKVFAEIGGFLVQGMEKGWTSEFSDLERAVSSDLNDLTGAVRVGVDSSAYGGRSAYGWSGNMNVTVNAAQGQNAEQIARYVEKRIMNDFTRRKAVWA